MIIDKIKNIFRNANTKKITPTSYNINEYMKSYLKGKSKIIQYSFNVYDDDCNEEYKSTRTEFVSEDFIDKFIDAYTNECKNFVGPYLLNNKYNELTIAWRFNNKFYRIKVEDKSLENIILLGHWLSYRYSTIIMIKCREAYKSYMDNSSAVCIFITYDRDTKNFRYSRIMDTEDFI